MKIQTPAYLKDLLVDHPAPCITLYMPTQRAKPPAAENTRRFSDLIDKAYDQLRLRYPAQKAEAALERFNDLLHDDAFWRHPTDALAVFGSPDSFQVVKLERPVRDYVDVASTFHLKPLIRALQFTGRFQILCLTQRNVSLWEGDRDHLEQLDLKGVPRDIFDALGLRSATAATNGDESRIQAISGSMDLDRFFRLIDRSVWENHSRFSGLPLMLCAVPNHHDPFRRASHNPYLMTDGIKLDPKALTPQRLLEEAWKIIEPSYQRQIQRIVEEYNVAKAHRQGSDDISQVAQAVASSRVGTLLVDSDKHVGGKIDPDSGRIQFGDLKDPQFDDLLDDIAERVIKTGGQVLVMTPDQMPSTTGLAAIYRF